MDQAKRDEKEDASIMNVKEIMDNCGSDDFYYMSGSSYSTEL